VNELSTATRRQQIMDGLRAVCTEGDGALSLIVLTPASSAATVLAATRGDAAARSVLYAGDALLRQIELRSRRTALLCTLCDSALWRDEPPDAIAVLLPLGVDAPTTSIGLAFCSDCCADRSDHELALAAVAKLREEAMPDLRVLPPTVGVVGHA
jgi:hypothetical protein